MNNGDKNHAALLTIHEVARLVESGNVEFDPAWVDSSRQASIEAAAARLGYERLRPIKEAVAPDITYGEIRLVLAKLARRRVKSAPTSNF